MPDSYYSSRTYYKHKQIFQDLTNGFRYTKIHSFNDKIKELIEEIEVAKLIDEDKKILKIRIKRELLNDYMNYVKGIQDGTTLNMKWPVSTTFNRLVQKKYDYEFKSIINTEFVDDYKFFEKLYG